MKILLVNPRDSPTNELFSDADGITAPLGLAYIAAYLRQHGFKEVKLIDANILKLNDDELKNAVNDFSPDVVGVGCLTPTIFNALNVVRIVKEIKKSVYTVFGGAHASAVPEEVLEDKNVDIVVRGEGEETMLALVKAISDKKPLSTVRGISYKNGSNAIIANPDRPLIKDLDSISFPAWDLLPMDKYYLPATRKGVLGKSATVLTSRGCPFNCIFCSKAVFGRTIRYRSPENIINEVEILKNKYNVREILFVDDTISLDKDRMIELCKLMIDKNLGISWECHSRVDAVTDDLLKYMKQAGCRGIAFGIESGSPKMLENIDKRITLEQAMNAIKLCRKHKITSLCSFMFGNPGETKDTAKKTIDFAKKLDPDFANFFALVPLPGSRVFKIAREKGRLTRQSMIILFHCLINILLLR